MRIKQTSIFKRRVKKMHSAEKESLDQAIKNIMSNPSIGEMKRGDLSGLQMQRHRHNNQQYLIAYKYIDSESLLTFVFRGRSFNSNATISRSS